MRRPPPLPQRNATHTSMKTPSSHSRVCARTCVQAQAGWGHAGRGPGPAAAGPGAGGAERNAHGGAVGLAGEGRAAAGHWNPTQEKHGRWGIKEHHSGDVGNINTDSNGYGKITVVDTNNRWSAGGSKNTNVIGRSIIVHANIDDGTSQPTGNAGFRVGCGVIKKP